MILESFFKENDKIKFLKDLANKLSAGEEFDIKDLKEIIFLYVNFLNFSLEINKDEEYINGLFCDIIILSKYISKNDEINFDIISRLNKCVLKAIKQKYDKKIIDKMIISITDKSNFVSENHKDYSNDLFEIIKIFYTKENPSNVIKFIDCFYKIFSIEMKSNFYTKFIEITKNSIINLSIVYDAYLRIMNAKVFDMKFKEDVLGFKNEITKSLCKLISVKASEGIIFRVLVEVIKFNASLLLCIGSVLEIEEKLIEEFATELLKFDTIIDTLKENDYNKELIDEFEKLNSLANNKN